jgi:ribonuclease-3
VVNFLRQLISLLKIRSKEEKNLSQAIKSIIGTRPINLSLYNLALKHSSASKTNKLGYRESNERLEYFGDAVLGLIVAELLFLKFPFKDEGFLTEMRSKIVNRESLNQLGRKIGLVDLIDINTSNRNHYSHKSIYGDTLEALIGAVYLDLGYRKCRKFVTSRLIDNHFDLNQLKNDPHNFKSLIIEWAQKENVIIDFQIEELENPDRFKQFEATVIINGKEEGKGYGLSKKKAEQGAAQKAYENMNLGN